MTLHENTQSPERVMLISVDNGSFSAEESIEELSLLVSTAGGEAELELIQKLPEKNPATYVGSGRIAEIKKACEDNEIDLIVADDELSPAQLKNIEDITGVRVVDRTMLILDIFALHARTREGKLQVELAQLKYSLPFLTGRGKGMSRLGGGIGTRGPGESKLESDKRHIRRRINALEAELKQLEKRRNNMRSRRKKDGIISVAIVGYTNAGKSTLMNRLTSAGVLAEDKLFATLDPTARKLTLPNGQAVMLVDTVGLVRRLPHKLVEAFKSTLEEAKNADLILNVCDASSEECAEHLRITAELLSELECDSIPVISVMNKCDLVPDIFDLPTIGKSVMISALNGQGVDDLLEEIQNTLPKNRTRVKLLIPFDKGGILAQIRADGVVHSEEFTSDGTLADVTVNLHFLEEIKEYIAKE
ncbi:MAG: GTPase HflX [Clostridia bacterium]|nr:GTPase HflX [Clostridia bacterium]